MDSQSSSRKSLFGGADLVLRSRRMIGRNRGQLCSVTKDRVENLLTLNIEVLMGRISAKARSKPKVHLYRSEPA